MPCLLRIQLSPCQHPHLLPKLQPWSGGIDNSSWGFFFLRWPSTHSGRISYFPNLLMRMSYSAAHR